MSKTTGITGTVPDGIVTASPTTSSPPPRPVLWFRQITMPLLLFVLPAIALALPRVWVALDLNPAPLSMMGMWGMNITMLAILVTPIWWLTFSGLTWRTKFIGLGLAILVIGGGIASVREWDITGNVAPYPMRFVWQPSTKEILANYLDNQEPADGLPAVDLTIRPTDFPRYRNVDADGIVTGLQLRADWQNNPPKILWKHPVGGGFAGFAVAGNSAITIEQRGDKEAIVCYDSATGRQRWIHEYPAQFTDPTGSGPRSTPTIDRGDVFTFGALGDLVCLEGKTGKLRWAVNAVKDSNAKPVTWAMTCSPLIVGDLVVVNPGIDPKNKPEDGKGMAVAAYDRHDGKRVWAAGDHPAGYSSPQLARLAGREQILLFDGGGVAGSDLLTGKELWRYPWTTFQDMNIVQPLVLSGDRVFISSEMSNGCAMLHVTKEGETFKAEEVWANNQLGAKYANPVLVGDSIYGLSSGRIVCLDSATGTRRWRGKDYFGHGQMLAVGKLLVVLSEKGSVSLVDATPDTYRERGQIAVFTDKTWNTPAIARGKLFIRNHVEMACLDLPTE